MTFLASPARSRFLRIIAIAAVAAIAAIAMLSRTEAGKDAISSLKAAAGSLDDQAIKLGMDQFEKYWVHHKGASYTRDSHHGLLIAVDVVGETTPKTLARQTQQMV